MKFALSLCLALLLPPAYAADPPPCAFAGDPVHWIADFCMAKLETDDEIAASECINKELRRTFPDECAAKGHYKRALCELAIGRQAIAGTVESCIEDPTFQGKTVENGGVGD